MHAPRSRNRAVALNKMPSWQDRFGPTSTLAKDTPRPSMPTARRLPRQFWTSVFVLVYLALCLSTVALVFTSTGLLNKLLLQMNGESTPPRSRHYAPVKD